MYFLSNKNLGKGEDENTTMSIVMEGIEKKEKDTMRWWEQNKHDEQYTNKS